MRHRREAESGSGRQFLGSRIMMLINIHNAPESFNAVFIGHSREMRQMMTFLATAVAAALRMKCERHPMVKTKR
jgi:hypothetical protein